MPTLWYLVKSLCVCTCVWCVCMHMEATGWCRVPSVTVSSPALFFFFQYFLLSRGSPNHLDWLAIESQRSFCVHRSQQWGFGLSWLYPAFMGCRDPDLGPHAACYKLSHRLSPLFTLLKMSKPIIVFVSIAHPPKAPEIKLAVAP